MRTNCLNCKKAFDKNLRSYRGEDWSSWKTEILKRDNHCCQRCAGDYKLAVHHIIPWKYSKKNSLTNLITLCCKCHMKEENFYRQFKTPSLFIKRKMEGIYPGVTY